MKNYYSEKLSAERLQRCYEVASPRVRQYLEAEIEFVLDRITPTTLVLELGCGYGRVLQKFRTKTSHVVGIDTSHGSLVLVRETLDDRDCHLAQMNASTLGFRDQVFDVVACIQNGISAFRADQHQLMREAIRVTRPGGRVLFSSYSARFWEDRLEWFRVQAQHGLVGEIDEETTGDGVIVCKDGFKATTIGPDEFAILSSDLEVTFEIIEVDESSIFCEILKK